MVHAWRSVIESIEPDLITHKSIRSLLFPPTELDLPTTTIEVPPSLHESIHSEAAERGMSIVDLIKMMFEFFITGGNSHPWQHDINTEEYAEKERIWLDDLAKLTAENESIT